MQEQFGGKHGDAGAAEEPEPRVTMLAHFASARRTDTSFLSD